MAARVPCSSCCWVSAPCRGRRIAREPGETGVLRRFDRGGVQSTLVEHHEQRREFAIDITRRAVGPRALRIRHDDGTDQAEVGLGVPRDMAVIEPALGTGLARSGTGRLVEVPHIRVTSPRGPTAAPRPGFGK